MRKEIVAILSILLALGITESNAQIGSFLKDKVQKAAEKGVKKNEEQKATEKQEEQKNEQKQKGQQQNDAANSFMQKKMMGLMGLNNVKYDLTYAYTSNMKMDIETVDSASTEVNKVTYTSYFDKNSKNFAMEFEGVDQETGEKVKSLMIFDYKNMAMLILSDKDGQKSGMAMVIPSDSTQTTTKEEETTTTIEQEDLSAYNTYYKATGRTKKIAGYTCKEYAYENPEGRAEVWTTNDFKYDYSSAYGQMGGFQALAITGGGYLMGTVMEMHFRDNDSNARSDLFVKEINPNTSKTYNISDYQIVGIGSSNTTESN